MSQSTRVERTAFNTVGTVGREFDYIAEAFQTDHISGDGRFSKLCHDFLERELGVERALLTTSCTHALEMAALLLDTKAGDEFILPSFTFVSTANAFVLRGARPVFVDIRPDTLNIDESLIESAITNRTKAIIVVHYSGVACEMDAIMQIANRYGLTVIEDNAHGLFGRYKGKYLGTFGALATQSFHETKNFTCGEGGALLINDVGLVERAEIIREKGTNRASFFRGQIDKYTWVDLGSSYLPSDILAAVLYAQLEKKDLVQEGRRRVWEFYRDTLGDWADANDVRLPTVPEECEQTYHLFYLILPSLSLRQRLIEHLKRNNVASVFHYVPLHTSDMGQHFGGKTGDCPVTESISDRLVRLPLHLKLNQEHLERVLQAVTSFDCAAVGKL
jgi:dTDP-4-amino-4,6-dideoxygalactose transaminase